MGPRARSSIAVSLALLSSCAIFAAEPFHVRSESSAELIVGFDRTALQAVSEGQRLTVERFPLAPAREIVLELERFVPTSPRTRFVVGRTGGPDEPLDFDPSGLRFFRGRVRGRPESSVFLALGERLFTGRIDLGGGAGRFRLSSRGGDGRPLGPDAASVFAADSSPTLPPEVPLCGVGDVSGDDFTGGPAPAPRPGLKHLQLAVETDYEYYQLFDSLEDAAAYLTALYAEVSEIYLRDLDVGIELVYARFWDNPDDLFDTQGTSPLSAFRNYWNSNMGAVQRDVAQFLSGQRTFPFGGEAYVSSLCGNNAYSVVGYALGFFPDPSRPHPYQYDIEVTAHELGHNSGSFHTQDYELDSCDDPGSTPQRGSLMSYCGQTWSGGNAVQDLYFRTEVQAEIDDFVEGATCVADDCNQNGVSDPVDISFGVSPDANLDGTPDVCQDCNQNAVLDPADLSGGTSQDLNSNDLPDECEADCNANRVPDDRDIALGTSTDAYGNGVPDECETDCNGNDVSDYTEIQADMSRDIDRDALLDACQDCDGDGTPDRVELAGAHDVWVASGLAGSPIRRFFASTGVRTAISPASPVQQGQDLILAPDGRVWVSSAADDRVLQFDASGSPLGDLVPPGLGGLDQPAGLALTPGGSLLVASRGTDSVLAYDATTGAFLSAFVPAGSGGLDGPFGLTLGPNGNLFVTTAAHQVLEYDGGDGSFVRVLVPAGSGGLDDPRGLLFKGDGNLLVASYGTSSVIEYDGTTGASLGKWAKAGTSSVLTQARPWGLRVGPNGNVFVVRTGTGGSLSDSAHHEHDDEHIKSRITDLHLTNAQIYEYDVRNGNYLRAHVSGNDHGLLFPTAFAFVPGFEIDCNRNQLPDPCDVGSGASADADEDGIPDECEVDCDGNGASDLLDIIPHGSALDCNSNLVPDTCDLASDASADCTANGIPDECEPDCNANGEADVCELAAGSVADCDGDGVPDECEASDSFESTSGWSTSALGDNATDGAWVNTNPNGTSAQTEFDHSPGAGRRCFVTGQGTPGGSVSADDVDGGRTTLTSPPLDLTGYADPEIGYWRWFSNHVGPQAGTELFQVDVSSNGGSSWTPVEVVGPGGPQAAGGWFFHKFRVASFVTPTATVQLRFVASDLGSDSNVEAAIDDLVLVGDCCESAASCGDGLACTLDSCKPTGSCAHAVAAGTCLIAGECFADGDGDPQDECRVCDADAPASWTPAPPVEVTGVEAPASGGTLAWAAQTGAVYDLVGGALSALTLDGGVSAAECLENDEGLPLWTDPRPVPLAGLGYYYLVRAEKECGAGGYGTDSAGTERIVVADCP